MCSESIGEVDIVMISEAEIAILGNREREKGKSKKNSMTNDGLRKKVRLQRVNIFALAVSFALMAM